jgi:hypothetical protein
LLREQGVLGEADVQRALAEQARTGEPLGQILLSHGLVSRPLLDRILARQAGVVLEAESGFGSGLRGLIEQRHLERAGVQVTRLDVEERSCDIAEERQIGNRRAIGDRRKRGRRAGDAAKGMTAGG